MPIRNSKPKPKASGKTDAMKALASRTDDAETAPGADEDTPTIEYVPAPRRAPTPPPRPVPPVAPKLVMRQAPVSTAAVAPAVGAKEAPEPLTKTLDHGGKIAFDPQVWQWRDEGGWIHIKTGEVREESEFIDPDEKAGETSGEDWDSPQAGADDW